MMVGGGVETRGEKRTSMVRASWSRSLVFDSARCMQSVIMMRYPVQLMSYIHRSSLGCLHIYIYILSYSHPPWDTWSGFASVSLYVCMR